MPETKPRYDLSIPIAKHEWGDVPLGATINYNHGSDSATFLGLYIEDNRPLRSACSKDDNAIYDILFGDNWYLVNDEDAKALGRRQIPLTKEEKYNEIVKEIQHESVNGALLAYGNIKKIINS